MDSINQYANQAYVSQASANTEFNIDVYFIVSILIFGSVLIFVAKMVYNFVKAAKAGTENFEQIEDEKDERFNSKRYVSIKNIKKNTGKVCVFCGKQNESDSKFCNNCGKRMP